MTRCPGNSWLRTAVRRYHPNYSNQKPLGDLRIGDDDPEDDDMRARAPFSSVSSAKRHLQNHTHAVRSGPGHCLAVRLRVCPFRQLTCLPLVWPGQWPRMALACNDRPCATC
jgi:hypothetical protein